jgi:hypothetical protein
MLMCSDVYLPLHGADNKSDLKAKNGNENILYTRSQND